MATSLAIILLFGFIFGRFFEKIHLPGLLGMILLGALIGPYGFSILSEDMILISADLRNIALIVILLRAGLGIKKEDIKKVGLAAIKLSFVPGILEGITILFLSMQFFNFTFVQAGILAFIIAAVSPAVIVPAMLDLMDRGLGKEKNIPTLILAGASIDDVFAITIFSTFLALYGGNEINIAGKILSIPISIILGILAGALIAYGLIQLFKHFHIPSTQRTLLVLTSAILLTSFEKLVESKIEIAVLLGVMAIGFILLEKMPKVSSKLSDAFNQIWVFAQILLFVLVGAEVDVSLALEAGIMGISIIAIGLIARSIGVWISLMGSHLNNKEKVFSMVAYLPKATVQAAIGAVPLAMGVEGGDLMLSLAVLSIVLTAPIGAIAIKLTGERLLS